MTADHLATMGAPTQLRSCQKVLFIYDAVVVCDELSPVAALLALSGRYAPPKGPARPKFGLPGPCRVGTRLNAPIKAKPPAPSFEPIMLLWQP